MSAFPDIAALNDGLDVMTGASERGTELLYVCVNGTVIALKILAPYGVKDPAAGKDLVLVFDEVEQEVIFLG